MSFSHPPILTIVARPDYRFAGGVAELLSNHADQVMANVAPDPERQKIVEHLFRALTDINAEGSAVRRPQTLAELTAVTGSAKGDHQHFPRRGRLVPDPLWQSVDRAGQPDRHQP
jgi:hypothetical protein